MSKLIQCTGAYAHKPYYFSKIGINVHSVEELCYSIVQYAFILDSEDFDSELTNWLSEECGLKKLAEGLEELLRRKGSAAGFAGAGFAIGDDCWATAPLQPQHSPAEPTACCRALARLHLG